MSKAQAKTELDRMTQNGVHQGLVLTMPEYVYADAADLEQGTLIVALDGTPVSSAGDLQRLMTEERIGETLTVAIVRQGAPIEIDVIPEELDE